MNYQVRAEEIQVIHKLNPNRIKHRREELGMDLEDLAKKMKLEDVGSGRWGTVLGLAEIEKGNPRVVPDSSVGDALVKILNISVEWLSDPGPPDPPRRYEAVLATREKYRGL